MFSKLRLSQLSKAITGKRVLMRADFNVPIKKGKIDSNVRITETLPTINEILKNKPASLVIMSHLGRPDGNKKPEASLKPVAEELSKLLGKPVRFIDDCVGQEAIDKLPKLKDGEIVLLENLRYYPEEEGKGVNEKGEKIKASKDAVKTFSKKLTSYGDIFVNDAFGTAHRAHASMTGINLPLKAAGLLVEKELEFFGKALDNPKKPVVIVLGGAKVSDKLPLIKNLLKLADEIIIGGGMAFTFLKELHGTQIGNSLYDAESAKSIKELMEEAKKANVKITLPVDYVVAKDFKNPGTDVKTVDSTKGIEPGFMGLDIGPKTAELYRKSILNAKTIIMNGPMGMFEVEQFASGSKAVVQAIVDATSKGAISIVGGGDSVNLISKVPNANKGISHISTGGGASLELLEGKKLPGIEFLSDKNDAPK